MTRQQKYPDTSTFHYHNANPKNRMTTDCVIRAISTALELPYNQVVMEMAEMQCKTGYDPSENKLIGMYLQSKGWIERKQPRKFDGTKYTGAEFCKEVREGTQWGGGVFDYTRIVANLGGHHTAAIINGKVWDIWNSTGGCIGKYWVK